MADPAGLGTVDTVSDRVNRRNYYRVLHVQHDAPAAVITSSYRALMRTLEMHPDRGGDHWNAALLNEAYRVLSDPAARAAYDERILDRVAPQRRGPSEEELDTSVVARSLASRAGGELCLFCGTESSVVPDPLTATCPVCGSPLTLAPLPLSRPADEGRRATSRMPRDGRLRCFEQWPQSDPIVGSLVDLSVGGLRFVSPARLEISHIVKLEGKLLDAVGRVVRCVAEGRRWTVGIEFYTLRLHEQRGTFVSTTA